MTLPALRQAAIAFERERTRARRHRVLAYVAPMVPPVVAVTLFADMMQPAATLPGFPAATFHDYMAPGAVLLSGMMFAGFTAVGVAEDLRSGFADRLALLGLRERPVTLGRLAFEAARILPAAVAAWVVAVGLGTGLTLASWRGPALLGLGLVWAVAYNGLFHVVARRTRNPHAPIAMQPLFAVVTFPSTFWFPAALMPDWGEALTSATPMSWITEAGRALATAPTSAATIALGVAAVVATGLAVLALPGATSRRS